MPVQNNEIAEIFEKVADLLEIQDANPFRVRAYRQAAATIRRSARSIADRLQEGEDLSEMPNIGDDLAGKIEEIVRTGSLQQLQELQQEIPLDLADLMDIQGLGAKKVQTLHDELGIETRDDLREAAEQGRIREIDGFGEKSEQNILDELERASDQDDRIQWRTADQIVQPLREYLNQHEGIDDLVVAGSYRRRKETVGDLDILATGSDSDAIMDHFVGYDDVDDVTSRGETRSSVVLRSGLQVDLRVVAPQNYGAAVQYFTGSKAHNITLRDRALERDWKMNEYGIFNADDEQIAGETEGEMYDALDLPFILPELREDRGEIAAAEQNKLPQELITVDAIRGDLHSHTTDSDGQHTLAEMARAAQEFGHAYLAITDHSPALSMTQGLDADALHEQIDRIDELNESFDTFRLLKAIEVDILDDGSLDLPDDVLARLDVCVCSVHTQMNLSQEQQTERIIRAMDNPHVNILAHPTGRRIGERAPMAIDMEAVMTAAVERGCYLEINSQPDRLDLDDAYCHMAKDMGLKLAINTDAHSKNDLPKLRYGVGQARRGWLETDDILNTRSWDELQALLDR